MAKKASKQQAKAGNPRPVPTPRPQPAPAKKAAPPAPKTTSKYRLDMFIAAGIAIVTFIAYRLALGDQFSNWDDPGYVTSDPYIRDLSSAGINAIFSNQVMGNYHPLTILSYAIEYSYVHYEPWLYHFDSILLHIIDTLLVYVFVRMLTRRTVAAMVVALLFGLHPMHVESVAWIAGRKDVVYTVFFMASLIFYILYIRSAGTRRWVYYALTSLMFVDALLGKPVAVTLPVVLLLIDYFEKRKWRMAVFLEKIPWLIVSVIFGIISIKAQAAFGALNSLNVHYNALERIQLGCYALVTYLWKAVVPIALANFYPYPANLHHGLPAIFYFYPVVVIALGFIVWRFFRRNRIVLFGLGFFMANIILLLQFIPVGGAIVAERYAYIPYIGLFFIGGWYVSNFFEAGANKQTGKLAIGIVIAYAAVLGFLTSARCQVWYDGFSLWRDEIEKYPSSAPSAYNNLGFEYFEKWRDDIDPNEKKLDFDSAYYLLNKAVQLQADFVNPYISLGEMERSRGNQPAAARDYDMALKLDPKNANAYLGKAIFYCLSNKIDSGGMFFKKSIELQPFSPEAHSGYGNYLDMTGHPDSALKEYSIAIQQNPDFIDAYMNRGRAEQRKNDINSAEQDFLKATQIRPQYGEAYYCLAQVLAAKGNKAAALDNVNKAMSLGYGNVDKGFYEQLKK